MKKLILTSALLLSAMIGFAQSSLTFKPFLANTVGQYITKESILAEPILGASPTPSTITEFTITIVSANGDSYGPVTIKGNKLDDKSIQFVKNMKSGTKIIIEKAKIFSGKDYEGTSVTYLVK